jgi:general secretion pathway protein C
VLAAVLSLTLFGAGNGAQSSFGDSGVPAAPEPSSAPVTTPLAGAPSPPADGASLTGTILATKSANTRMIITDMRGRQRVYARGDEIADGGEVVEIHRDYVVLRRGARLETLEFSWNAATHMFERAMPVAQATPPEDYREVLRHAMFTHPELLLQMVGATVVVEGGHFRGYRVMQPEDPTFLDSLGLKPGDILTGVNGVPLDTPDYGTHVLDAMSGTGKLLTIQRGNQTLVVSE